MQHYLLELAVWILVAFFLGCAIGWLLRSVFGAKSAPRAEAREQPAAPPVPAPVAAAEPAVEPEPAAPVAEVAVPQAAMPVAEPIPSMRRMERPRGLSAARGGIADNLQRISGIGPKNEKILHTLGIFHFDQIAGWSADHVAWVDDHLRFNGRITRERWIDQAEMLAAGREEEFKANFGAGAQKR